MGWLDDHDAPYKTVSEKGKPSQSVITHLVAKTEGQQDYLDAIEENRVVFCHGPAGTGKSFCSAGSAAIAFRKHEFDRIVCVRPAVGAGEHIGFLPGTSDEKMMPYLRPIMLELQRFFPRGEFSSLRRCKPDELMAEIEIQPLEFMRGLTFRKSFIIVDEAQNCTHEQMKMVITRLGKGSKMIINGDDTQSDLPEHLRGGFRKYSEMFYGIDGIETVYLSTADIVRDPLLQQMMERIIRADHARSY
jgi:phosphate starvation-inducible PhoH-like protein